MRLFKNLIKISAKSFSFAALIFSPALADTISINFDSEPLGAEATNLYTDQGVRFPSRPTIEREGSGNALQQGFVRGGPDPLPTTVACAPLEMEFNASMDVRSAQMRVINRHLRAYNVIAYSGDIEVDRFQHFAPSAGPPYPPIEFFRDITLGAADDEGGITRVVANPPADCFDLMVIDNLVLQTNGTVSALNRFEATAVEVTQGVMSRLTRLDGVLTARPDTRLMALPGKRLVFVQGRDTAVRFFIEASARTETNPALRLVATITYADGTRRTQTLTENTAGGSQAIAPPAGETALQARRRLALTRANVNQTLDFVVPDRVLQNAVSMRLRLETELSGMPIANVEVPFSGSYRLGLNVARVNGTGADSAIAGPPARTVTSLASQFIEELYPITGNVLLRESGVLTMNTGTAASCWTFLAAMDAAIAGTTAAAPVAGANYWTNMYILTNTPPDCGGLGWYNTPGALTNTNFSTAAHEVGHNIGINHASDGLHGEPGDREVWPYLHGSIGAIEETKGFDDGVFGALMISSTPGVDLLVNWGSWTLTVVPPCRGMPAQLFPDCTVVDAQMMHDYMSYGPGGPTAPFGQQTWISDINFHRIQRFLQDCTALDPVNRFMTPSAIQPSFTDSSGACNGAGLPAGGGGGGMAGAYNPNNQAPVDALIFTGVIEANGDISGVRAVRKLAARNALIIPSGAYYFVMYAADGRVLNRIPFAAKQPSSEAKTEAQSFLVTAPYDADVQKIAIEFNQETVYSESVEGKLPKIELMSPVGGEKWRKGKRRIQWRAEDPKAEYYVQYSPDKGASWYPLGLIRNQTYLNVNVEDLAPSNDAMIYISASNGLATTYALSPKTFIVGNLKPQDKPATADLKEDCLDHDLNKLEVKMVGDRWKIVQGNRYVFDFEGNADEAKQAFAILKRFGFDKTCYVGRPDPSMTYLKQGSVVPGGSSSGLDCISFDRKTVGVRQENNQWLLYSGRSRMAIFPNKQEAEKALAIIQAYRLNRQCYVGRPDPSFRFWLSES